MFGIGHEALIENLETLRKSLCGYMGERCDCKFGATRKGEQTGCPEIREAIAYLKGEHDTVIETRRLMEESALNQLNRIRAVLGVKS